MASAKVAITLDEKTLKTIDRYVREKRFPNRSRAIQSAVEEKLQKLEHSRLARECAKLDPKEEKALADQGLASELEHWPKY